MTGEPDNSVSDYTVTSSPYRDDRFATRSIEPIVETYVLDIFRVYRIVFELG